MVRRPHGLVAAWRDALAAEGGAAVNDIPRAASLLVVAVLAVLVACAVLAAWSWAAERVFDRALGAMEAVIRWIASR